MKPRANIYHTAEARRRNVEPPSPCTRNTNFLITDNQQNTDDKINPTAPRNRFAGIIISSLTLTCVNHACTTYKPHRQNKLPESALDDQTAQFPCMDGRGERQRPPDRRVDILLCWSENEKGNQAGSRLLQIAKQDDPPWVRVSSHQPEGEFRCCRTEIPMQSTNGHHMW